MLTKSKSSLAPLLDKLTAPLSTVNPNVLTGLGLVFPVLFAYFLVQEQYIIALVMYGGISFDLLDGHTARRYGKVTKFGGFLDSTLDRISDAVIIGAFAAADLVSWPLAALLIVASFLISYIRSRAELAASGKISLAVGIIERSERLIFIGVNLVLWFLFPEVTISGYNLLEVGFFVLTILSLVTICQRILVAKKKLSKL